MDAPESMREFLGYHRRMVVLMSAICVVVVLLLALAMPGDLSWAGGFAVGAAARLAKFGILDIAAIKKMAAERKDAALVQVKTMYLFLVILAAAGLLVYRLGLNVWAMAAGIFLPNVVLLAETWLRPNLFGQAKEGDGGALGAEDEGV